MESLYQILSELEKARQTVALCTVVGTRGSTPRHTTSKMLVYQDGHIDGSVGGGELENRVRKEAMDAMRNRKPRLLKYEMSDPMRGDAGICGGQVEVFVEPILPSPTIIVVGGGHVGNAVAHLAKWLGFHIVLSDDRPEFCSPSAIPDADEFINCSLSELPLHQKITPQTFIILTTRGNNVDIAGLPSLLESHAGYIGVIGSRKRWSETVNALNENGISEDQLKRVHSPIGLKIGAETPQEIAVSIMAEVLLIRENGIP